MSKSPTPRTAYIEFDPLMARDLDTIRRAWHAKTSRKGTLPSVITALLREPIQRELEKINSDAPASSH